MRRPYHPSWCDPAECRAYGHPDLEPDHRSTPIVIRVARGEVLAVFLAESQGHRGTVRVEVAALYEPLLGPVWAAEDVAATLSLPLDPAAALAQALRQLIRTATA